MTHPRARLLIVLPLLALLPFAAALPAGDDAPSGEARARALAEAQLRFAAYVFTGTQFPAGDFEHPDQAARLLGPYTLRVAHYDAQLARVEKAAAPGPYAAVVEVVPKEGRPLRRLVTLYRAAAAPDPAWHFDPAAPAELARWADLDPDLVKRQTDLVQRELKTRPAAELVRDPRVARLLAGLSLSTPKDGPFTPANDALARERQWWVDLGRRLDGLDQRFPGPFVCPRPLKGEPAPVLREGTAAEAGMKPDAADKIDAVLRTWAADDDQAFAVCIARKGVIVLHRAYGTRDGQPMTVTTRSWMASITKTMSALLMMMLVDQGKVNLDDPVEKYLPALGGRRKERPLTIRHLYTHTSGLEKWPSQWYHDELPDIADRVALAYPYLKVGEAWGYGGQSYTLGGKVIEAVTGEAIPPCYAHHLLGPLGCTHTDVTGTHADARSVPLDMAKVGQLLLNRGAYGPQQFFRPATFAQMLPEPLTKVLGPDTKRTFGIGLDGTREKIGHGAASAATFHVDRADELVVVMTRNKMGKNQERYNGKFWDALRSGIDRGAPAPPP